VPGGPVVSIVALFSGAAGLMFEIVWFYRCGLVFGNSVWAASIVLSSFMGGLAIGSGITARIVDRVRRPLRAYAAAELAVAVSGIALAHVLTALPIVLAPLVRYAADAFFVTNALRLTTAFALLLAPATAMGATLPLLVDELCRQGRPFGPALGRLYGWNTIGAVGGAIATEVVLIRKLGVTGTAWTAGALDVVAALAALSLAWRSPAGAAKMLLDAPAPERPPRLLAAAFLAGGLLLALEVVWFRFLSMYVLTTTLAMSLMLAVVLAAIGLGGFAASAWIARAPRSLAILPALCLAAGSVVVLSYASFQSLTAGTQVGDWSHIVWFACVLAFPASLLSGAIFTLLGDAVARQVGGGGRAAAWLMLANTTGAACGPLVASFILLPVLGLERSVFVLSAGYAIVAVATVPLWNARSLVGRPPVGLAAALALVVALVAFPFGSMRGVYMTRAAAAYSGDGSEIVATREGPSETILLMQQSWLGKPVYHRLVTNGFSMSGTSVPALRYMRDFVYLPMALHQDPLRRVLVICYGVGVTAGAATDVASAESIDVVEISRDVLAMSDAIYAPDRHPLRDPRVRVHIEDGRYFLQTTSERFDLITGEPPPPRTPGAVNIYTREYFQLVRDRLADGGMTTYWLPVGRPNPGTDVNTIVRAFCDVFDDCSLWNATPFDLMLLGSRGSPRAISEADFARPWGSPALAERLGEIGFEEPIEMAATFLGDAGFLRELTTGAPPLTDDFPQRLRPDPARPSLSDPRYGRDAAVTLLYQRVLDPSRAQRAFAESAYVRRVLPGPIIERALPMFDVQRVINRVFWEGGKPLHLIEDLDTVLTDTTLRTLPLWILGTDDVKQRIARQGDDGTGAVEYARGLDALASRDYLAAATAFADGDRRGFHGVTLRPLLAYALCKAGHADAVKPLAARADLSDEDARHFWAWLHARFGVS
jgi:spermidine synthase